tara:strand:- start:1968 stop:2123 length:156 start_codon:yes stop_codon:yes gene_type:complete
LVQGEDIYDNFELTPVTRTDFDPAYVAFHSRATAAIRDVLYSKATQTTDKL